jgi:hypothetical protein
MSVALLALGRAQWLLVIFMILAMICDWNGNVSPLVAGAPSDDDASDDVVPLKNDADRDGRLSFEEIAAFLQAS